ncbi:hypothetical protein KL918_004589 [Ogataea parapolymorpha]|uniref:PHD-type domain-containing protein n=1 Tax=Ogataea parapolymorpha (strain ATCC 26012 / BCRC 20466 / JCM 22074 / NRRL Y-7560 / DL-1) TaxID=871575 RepID=W1QL66_OGAPD|nr:hypothetical protein HPODL_00046 [Ogataea parapolymorpha DL-1]ESX03545.1 hypothetical protein HPODL_00046 [Ogataea parapolymorpha DL-1]KAG7865347.1 hypothetical protein KL918_004589 [Ogataea parapolymorpha]KAG7873792.1 hypothetical protein KL916_001952 [Ogataea parapolymorpha]
MLEDSSATGPPVGQQMPPRIKLPSLASLGDDFSLPPLTARVSETGSVETKITLPSLSALTESIPDVLRPVASIPAATINHLAEERSHKPSFGIKHEDGLAPLPSPEPAVRLEAAGVPKTSRHRNTEPCYFLQNVPDRGEQSQLAEAVPVHKPSSQEFAAPIAYIESLSAEGEHYGAVKIVVPEKKPAIEIRGKLGVRRQTKRQQRIANAGTRPVRSRDQLLRLGFEPRFDASTVQKAGLTVPDAHTLPSYDFYHWSESSVDEDDAETEFFADLREFDALVRGPELGTENGFWESDFDAFYALHTPAPCAQPEPWNLQYLGVCEGSLLQYLSEETSLLAPRVRVASRYSCENWSLEDHFLQRADHHRSGAPKIWYFIPPSERTKFEEMRTARPVARAALKHEPLRRFIEPGSECFDESVLVTPAQLRAHGVQFFATVQFPGEIVLKYPGTYSLCFSLGTSVSESVRFASRAWLKSALPGAEWLQRQQLPPAFSTFRLLTSVAVNCDDRTVLAALEPVLETLVARETQLREAARASHIKETSTAGAAGTSVTEADLADAFPSYVVVSDRRRPETLTMSVARFLATPRENHELRAELCVQLSDDALRVAQRSLRTKLVTGAQWLAQYDALIAGYDKPSTKLLRPLLAEGDAIFQRPEALTPQDLPAFDTYRQLKKYYRETEDWAARAAKFLQFKVSTRMRQRRGEGHADPDSWNELADLDTLLRQIPQLPVSTPEMDQLLEYCGELAKYNDMVQQLLHRPDDKELESLHLLGSSLGVRLNSYLLLDRILRRSKWLRKVRALDYAAVDTRELAQLLEEGEDVAATGDRETVEKLQQTHEQALAANRELLANIDDVARLRELYDQYESLPLDHDVRQQVSRVLDEYAAVYAQLEQIAQTVQLRFGELAQPDELLRMIDSNLRYFDASFQPSRPLLQEITQKVARYPALAAEHQTLQFYEHQVDVWYEQLVLYFGLAKVKKLRSYFEEWQRFDEQVFAEPPDSASYCVCRMRHENGIMIECEACEQWFHFGCLGLRDEDEAEISGFLCPICDVDMRFKSTRYHLDQVDRKPTLAQLVEFVYWSNSQLTVLPPEYRNILWILRNCYTFKLSISDILENDLAGIRHALRRMEGCRVNFEDDRRVLRAKVAELMRVDRRVDTVAPESQ